MKLDHLDLFSGIGGFALAARWAGIETIQFVEIDKFCQKVLQKNFPGVSIHDDIKTFTYTKVTNDKEQTRKIDERGEVISKRDTEIRSEFGRCSSNRGNEYTNLASPFLITGGFPCQPFSCAGKRRGKEDDRYLWPEMLRVVSEAKPRWIIGENVAGFINMGLDDCISDLENQGYEVQVFVIPACAVNAPHRRDRVWIVANSLSDTTGSAYGRNSGRSGDRRHEQNISQRNEMGCDITDEDCHAPDTNSQYSKEYQRGDKLRYAGKEGALGWGIYEPSWQEPWLEVATRLCRMDDGVSNRVDRLKALGNAIVPQVAYKIMKAILGVEFS